MREGAYCVFVGGHVTRRHEMLDAVMTRGFTAYERVGA